MKKWDFIKLVAERTGLTQQDVNKVVDEAGRIIVEQVRDNGEEIAIPTIGTFKQKVNPARTGRNPKNGNTIEIKGSRSIAFRPMPSVRVFDETKKKVK